MIFYRLFSLGLCLFFAQFATAQLTVEIRNLEDASGKMFIAVYDSEDSFLDVEQAVRKVMVDIPSTEFSYVFSDLPPGEYAIGVYQDRNDNKKIDKNFMGIPTEPFGFSNDAKIRFGPPSYEDAMVVLEAAPKTIRFHLR